MYSTDITALRDMLSTPTNGKLDFGLRTSQRFRRGNTREVRPASPTPAALSAERNAPDRSRSRDEGRQGGGVPVDEEGQGQFPPSGPDRACCRQARLHRR